MPEGWRVAVDYLKADYVGRNGEPRGQPILARISPLAHAGPEGAQLETHFWLAPRKLYDTAAAEHSELRLTYSLSLLERTASAKLPADGTGRYLEGFGYCSSQAQRSRGWSR